jgi:hypothetical protein
MPAPQITLLQLLNRIFLAFLTPAVFIIPIFIALKFLRFKILSEAQADKIIAWVKPLWPVIVSQYASAKRDPLGSRYYALLAIAVLIIIVIMIIYSMWKYYKMRKYISMPGPREFGACALFLLLFCFFLPLFDEPDAKNVKGFWADGFGIYYLRQYFFFLAAGMSIDMCILVIVRVADEGLRRLRGTDANGISTN